jgi:hypothetical protein
LFAVPEIALSMKSDVPVFFIGFPRSGTTVIFEAFCRHQKLGWPSAYTEKFPTMPAVEGLRRLLDNSFFRLTGRKSQYGNTRLGNRFLPQPHEAYRFWDLHTGVNFSRSFLREELVDAIRLKQVRDSVGQLLRWQGRPRFAAKLTGPPRIRFLDSVFPDCRFVHIIRDGRAAVHSLLHVKFWREKGGLEAPFWRGGLSVSQERDWSDNGRDPGELAALQWAAVLRAARNEARELGTGRYCELRYEDFVASPHEHLREMYEFCDLDNSSAGHDYLDSQPTLENMNYKFRQDFSMAYIKSLSSLMQPLLGQLQYPE